MIVLGSLLAGAIVLMAIGFAISCQEIAKLQDQVWGLERSIKKLKKKGGKSDAERTDRGSCICFELLDLRKPFVESNKHEN